MSQAAQVTPLAHASARRPSVLHPEAPPLITGLGVVSPYGMEIGPLFEALLTGHSRIDKPDWQGRRPARAIQVRGFEPAAHVKLMAIRRLDFASRYAVVAAAIALADAGVTAEEKTSMAVVSGTATLGTVPLANMMGAIFGSGPDSCNPSDFPVTVANSAAGQIALLHGLKGPNLTLAQKESSGLAALSAAAVLLASGQAERVLVSGADDFPMELWSVLDRLGVVAGGAEQGPFSAGRCGTIGGEGAFAMVLESPAAAARRNARPHARLLAAGDTHLGGAQHRWPETPAPFAQLLEELTARSPATAYIASANGSRLDQTEAEALALYVQGLAGPLPVTGFKYGLGESGAASLGQALLAVACLNSRKLPPLTATRAIDPSLPPLDFVTGAPRDLPDGPMLIGAISHGGAACGVLLDRAAADTTSAPF